MSGYPRDGRPDAESAREADPGRGADPAPGADPAHGADSTPGADPAAHGADPAAHGADPTHGAETGFLAFRNRLRVPLALLSLGLALVGLAAPGIWGDGAMFGVLAVAVLWGLLEIAGAIVARSRR